MLRTKCRNWSAVESGDIEIENTIGGTFDFLERQGFTIDYDPEEVDPVILAEVFGGLELWKDRFAREKPVPRERSIGHAIDAYLALLAKTLKPKTYADVRECLSSLRSFVADMDTRTLDEDKVEAVWHRLAEQDLMQATKKKRWSYFRRFIREGLVEKNLLEREPKNLYSRTFSFKVSAKRIKTWDKETIRNALKNLPDRLAAGLSSV